MVQQGINIALVVNDVVIAGQLNVGLTRKQSAIDITNKINGNWEQKLAGLKSWTVTCSGMYIKDQSAYSYLEDSFMDNNRIQVLISVGNKQYSGYGLITSFPLESSFDLQLKYRVSIVGDGELQEVIQNGD